MTDKHMIKVDTMPTVDEFKSKTWTGRKPYVGLTINKHEVFYNYASTELPGGGKL